ncbi:phosphatidylinositol-specific phospholipase C [Nannocystis sp. SCPEA4]|uniref:phosphatidylinositol-specific phospholipase C n=1 Tax=Nannocystis sp. SCPEA4 TaxID=2996787 RepID=UPI00226FB65E|nr:phosphatidylinositol-specific phospholipase C [Nannocystis sp. SCPEA4]MCY1061572.1 phosphatidylinositol-specific phospholipase C [Nannocystis sp. SCPEA4]
MTNASNWMSEIAKTKHLNGLAICGTHDSCTSTFPPGDYSRTQAATVPEQLANGIRFLDLRLDDDFIVNHNGASTDLTLTEVLGYVYAFLDLSPTEAVVMSIKREGTRTHEDDWFAAQMDGYMQAGRWYYENSIPTLEDARGKIVLFRRYVDPRSSPRGIDMSRWPDDSSFDNQIGSIMVYVQDKYLFTENRSKEAEIEKLLPAMFELNADDWYINFTSAAKGLGPWKYAKDINPWLVEQLRPRSYLHGVFMMDFPDHYAPGVIDTIIGLNAPSTAIVANHAGEVYHIDQNGNATPFAQVSAQDVGVSMDGTVWIVDNGVAKHYVGGFSTWQPLTAPPNVVRICGGPGSSAYAVDKDGVLWQLLKEGRPIPWSSPGTAIDVGFGGYCLGIVTCNPIDNGYEVRTALVGNPGPLQWHPPSPTTAGERIAIAPDRSAWLVNKAGEIWQIQPDGTPRPIMATGDRAAHDIGIGKYETVWIITGALKRDGGYAPAWLKDPAIADKPEGWGILGSPIAGMHIACR